MSEEFDDGGPAFPLEDHFNDGSPRGVYLGMTMRDYFAAKAMQGICAHHDTWGLQVEEIVDQAYAIADAMLKARKS